MDFPESIHCVRLLQEDRAVEINGSLSITFRQDKHFRLVWCVADGMTSGEASYRHGVPEDYVSEKTHIPNLTQMWQQTICCKRSRPRNIYRLFYVTSGDELTGELEEKVEDAFRLLLKDTLFPRILASDGLGLPPNSKLFSIAPGARIELVRSSEGAPEPTLADEVPQYLRESAHDCAELSYDFPQHLRLTNDGTDKTAFEGIRQTVRVVEDRRTFEDGRRVVSFEALKNKYLGSAEKKGSSGAAKKPGASLGLGEPRAVGERIAQYKTNLIAGTYADDSAWLLGEMAITHGDDRALSSLWEAVCEARDKEVRDAIVDPCAFTVERIVQERRDTALEDIVFQVFDASIATEVEIVIEKFAHTVGQVARNAWPDETKKRAVTFVLRNASHPKPIVRKKYRYVKDELLKWLESHHEDRRGEGQQSMAELFRQAEETVHLSNGAQTDS